MVGKTFMKKTGNYSRDVNNQKQSNGNARKERKTKQNIAKDK